MRKALVDSQSNTVINVIVLEEGAAYTPPEGTYMIDGDGVEMDYVWDAEQSAFVAPPPPPPPIPPPQ